MLVCSFSNICSSTIIFFLPGLSACTAVHASLTKWPIKKFKLDQQIIQQALRAYCPNINIFCDY